MPPRPMMASKTLFFYRPTQDKIVPLILYWVSLFAPRSLQTTPFIESPRNIRTVKYTILRSTQRLQQRPWKNNRHHNQHAQNILQTNCYQALSLQKIIALQLIRLFDGKKLIISAAVSQLYEGGDGEYKVNGCVANEYDRRCDIIAQSAFALYTFQLVIEMQNSIQIADADNIKKDDESIQVLIDEDGSKQYQFSTNLVIYFENSFYLNMAIFAQIIFNYYKIGSNQYFQWQKKQQKIIYFKVDSHRYDIVQWLMTILELVIVHIYKDLSLKLKLYDIVLLSIDCLMAKQIVKKRKEGDDAVSRYNLRKKNVQSQKIVKKTAKSKIIKRNMQRNVKKSGKILRKVQKNTAKNKTNIKINNNKNSTLSKYKVQKKKKQQAQKIKSQTAVSQNVTQRRVSKRIKSNKFKKNVSLAKKKQISTKCEPPKSISNKRSKSKNSKKNKNRSKSKSSVIKKSIEPQTVQVRAKKSSKYGPEEVQSNKNIKISNKLSPVTATDFNLIAAINKNKNKKRSKIQKIQESVEVEQTRVLNEEDAQDAELSEDQNKIAQNQISIKYEQTQGQQKNEPKYKSIFQLQRIERSKRQRIFLLQAERNQAKWKFKVLGTKGKAYIVVVSQTLSCTCIDFRFTKKPCKHIYFIVTQVAQADSLLSQFSNKMQLKEQLLLALDEQLVHRLKSRMQNKQSNKDIDLKDDTSCVICFCEMEKDSQQLQGCDTCKKYFHKFCINMWKQHNTTCPLCRQQLQIQNSNLDPLGQVTDIKI